MLEPMLKVIKADLADPRHADELIRLLDHYAQSPAGGGQALSAFTRSHLANTLSSLPHTFSLLAFENEHAVGLCNCVIGFSTFNCAPIYNVHDLVVEERYRGKGIGTALLEKVEELGSAAGACKLTLEVLENNERARAVYKRFGFAGYELSPEFGKALFLEKKL